MSTRVRDGRTAQTPAATHSGLRIAGLVTLASGVIAAVGVVFLVAMFASFAIGARSAGLAFGWINDVLVMISYLLAVPAVVAVHGLSRPYAPIRSLLGLVVGIVAITAIVVLQWLLVVGTLTFEAQIGPASIAFLGLASWFVLAGHLGQSTGILPRGVRMGLLAASYVGYPAWALWLSRRLLTMA